ncbi:MAG: methyltransferase domain-containing protein [Gemmatimonadota bacterium]
MTTTTDAAPAGHFRRGARPNRHQARRAATVLQLAEGLTGSALDYGCGWGDLTFRLAPQFERIEGWDVSAERVAFAATEFAPIPFRQCAEAGIELADASVDVVFSTVVLHFVPSPEGYLTECHRVLRPGGTLVVTIQNPDSMWMTARRWRRGTPAQPHWDRGVIKTWGGTLDTFRCWLEQQGFAIERSDGFYDPPLDRLRTPGEVVVSALNAVGHLCAIDGRWSYVGFRCRRVG